MSDEKDKPLIEGKVEFTDLAGLGKYAPAALEIVKAVSAGMGRIWEPAALYLMIRAKGAARRHERLANLKLSKQLSEIEETSLPTVASEPSEFADRTAARVLSSEYRRQQNIELAAAEAIDLASEEPVAGVHEVDEDFVAEWMDGVKDVSNEELRTLWATLMTKAPLEEEGRVEKPVVDFLRQMDPHLAEQLRKLYFQGYLTEGVVPLLPADLEEVAEEVGIGRIADVFGIDVIDELISVRAREGHFTIVEIGARAERLCNLVFGEPDPNPMIVPFLERFDEWLEDLVQGVGHVDGRLFVRVGGTTSVFNFHAHIGEMVLAVQEFAPPHEPEVKGIAFSDSAAHQALRATLMRMAAKRTISFVSRFPSSDRDQEM